MTRLAFVVATPASRGWEKHAHAVQMVHGNVHHDRGQIGVADGDGACLNWLPLALQPYASDQIVELPRVDCEGINEPSLENKSWMPPTSASYTFRVAASTAEMMRQRRTTNACWIQ